MGLIKDDPVPKIGSGDSSYRVWMSAATRRELGRLDFDGGVEVGGALFGGRDGKELWIADLCAATTYATRSTMGLDTEYIDRMAQRHRESTGWQVIGGFHSHRSEEH